jgi:hypothetical protein
METSQGRNLYSPEDVAAAALPQTERVFLSHRNADKPLAAAVALTFRELGIHYWFDREDQDTRRAAALGMVGEQTLVHAIERGVRHSTQLLGLLSANTTGSWWVPYELGVGRSSGIPVSFLVLASIRSMHALPEYVRLAANYWSVDELLVWAAKLRAPGAGRAPRVSDRCIAALQRYLPRRPPIPTTSELSERALGAIKKLEEPNTWNALRLTSTEHFDWLPSHGGVVRDLAYDLFAPVAFWLLREQELSTSERALLEAVFRSFTQHRDFARQAPSLPYDPNPPDWRTRRYSDPATTWLQGLSERQLTERTRRFLVVVGIDGQKRLATRDEFKAEFDRIERTADEADRRDLGVFVNPLLGFTPQTRPVYVRILNAQRRLYESFAAI